MADPNSWRFRSRTDPIYASFRPPPFPQLHTPPPPPWERPAHPPPPPFLPPPPPPFGFGGGTVDNGGPLKRPRYEDQAAVAAEDERRLNLVRFHGGHAAPPSVGHELYHSNFHGGPYDHRAPLRVDHGYPVARPDWRSSNHPSELPRPWSRDRYDGNQFGVRPPLPPLPSNPYPPCPPLPPPSQPGPSPASVINSSISPFKDPVAFPIFPVQMHVHPYQLNKPSLPVLSEYGDKAFILLFNCLFSAIKIQFCVVYCVFHVCCSCSADCFNI